MGLILTIPVLILASRKLPGFIFWIKWIVSYLYLFTYKKLTKRRFDLYDNTVENEPYKLGFLVPPEEAELESPCDESHLQHAADEVLCYGINSKSECLVTRVARGCDQESEAWIYLKLSNGKTYRLPEGSTHHQQPYRDKCTNYSCGGLQMHYIAPMRRWRVFYNGLLSESSKDNPEEEKIVHVKFSFIWRASSNAFDFPSDMNISLTAEALSKAKWTSLSPPVKRLRKMLDYYSQGGVLIGTVKVGGDPEQEIYLWGERTRFLGVTTHIEGAKFLHILGYAMNGSSLHLAKSSIPNLVQDLHFGHVARSNSAIDPIQKCEIFSKESQHKNEGEESEENYYAKFEAGRVHELNVTFVERASSLKSNKGWGGSLVLNIVKLKLNEFEGSGIAIVGTAHETPKRPQASLPVPIVPKVRRPLVIEFENKLCQVPELSGGKGSSLAKLTEISDRVKTFVVPRGVVLTTAAYECFLDDDIEKAIRALESVAYGKEEGDVKAACREYISSTIVNLMYLFCYYGVSKVLIEKTMPRKLHQEIEKILRVFGENINNIRFAVRSSATGEDTEQMSAAGQMDTYLGVKGLSEILLAVKKSWASQFGFVAVEYKRRYGQVLNSPMAVVIQEMIPCDLAGVLFTCDPLTGNPEIISITANYGLGESVVSGSSEPDTVILKRNIRNQLSVVSNEIGDKKSKIIMNDSSGTVEESVDEAKRRECCLSEEKALSLAKIALYVEESYRSPRDIEWGILNGTIFLLQSRPVTSGTEETDFEMKREFDSAIRREDEYLSVVNVGEVMPGATSPLGMEVILKFFGIAFQSPLVVKDPDDQKFQSKYFPHGIVAICGHAMFNLVNSIFRFSSGRSKTSVMAQSSMVSMFGRIVEDEGMSAIAEERFLGAKMKARIMFHMMFMSLCFAGSFLRKVQKSFKDYRVPIERYSTAEELFDDLTNRCSDLSQVMASHMRCSQKSSMWNMIILSSLANNKGGFEADVYRDFAYLLSTCNNVESADVPAAMQRVAYAITQNIDPAIFKAMTIEEALTWLQNARNSAGTKFREFLSRHGHRCLKEFDIHSITWGMDSKPLVKLLQNMTGNVKDNFEKEELNTNDVLSKLAIPLKLKYSCLKSRGLPDIGFLNFVHGRLLVKFLLPYCRQGVREREGSKSLLIKGLDGWRSGYHRLAELMVMEGRIPDKDLLFFLTLEEIQELLKTRSPKFISRANHRRRVFPEMDKYIFPEIMQGYPTPLNLQNYSEEPREGEFVMRGVPVSQGMVRATARVALTLEEADSLKAGEVLITYSTDIGWSPYFPILGGVVTELGGLISHGAVVAREYGLPCVVGLHGATRQFKTGDYVILDGNTGTLRRLSKDKIP